LETAPVLNFSTFQQESVATTFAILRGRLFGLVFLLFSEWYVFCWCGASRTIRSCWKPRGISRPTRSAAAVTFAGGEANVISKWVTCLGNWINLFFDTSA